MNILSILLLSLLLGAAPQGPEPFVDVNGGVSGHVQGVAADLSKGELYFSFTTRFIRTDLQGRVLGSIDRIQGHLGAMTYNPEDGCVYASLECKDDEIGAGVARQLGVGVSQEPHFYVAIIDVAKVDKLGMDPEDDPVLRTVCIKEAGKDYLSDTPDGARHLYGCSGIDGVTFAPVPGGSARRYDRLYVAYGVYGDNSRDDNDHQVILCYKTSLLRKLARTVSFGSLHDSGPARPEKKYFVRTGNTTYGVQNLAYDPFTGYAFMAVYRGRKPQWINYSLYAVDFSRPAGRARPEGVPYHRGKADMLAVTAGWNFPWGTTGMYPLGGGYWLFSENYRDPESRKEGCRLHLMRWTGDSRNPFEEISR